MQNSGILKCDTKGAINYTEINDRKSFINYSEKL